jgi:hypothetical protein
MQMHIVVLRFMLVGAIHHFATAYSSSYSLVTDYSPQTPHHPNNNPSWMLSTFSPPLLPDHSFCKIFQK